HILPLRERREDVFPLAEYFQNNLLHKRGDYQIKRFSDQAKQALLNYEWPGNIRELENMVERISVLVEEIDIQVYDLPECITNSSTTNSPSVSAVFNNGIGFNEAVDLYQRSLISHALNESGWVKARAAEMLKMNRTTLVEKLKKMHLKPEMETPIF
ncbi:MAG: sigma-54-dependent Fis family transcriptional regulator, partial [Desulfobacteraceae bacterium]|nr:sigma-54-dependent Fis family transcriptional regulator [Desulfobacteraceae bacterium]